MGQQVLQAMKCKKKQVENGDKGAKEEERLGNPKHRTSHTGH